MNSNNKTDPAEVNGLTAWAVYDEIISIADGNNTYKVSARASATPLTTSLVWQIIRVNGITNAESYPIVATVCDAGYNHRIFDGIAASPAAYLDTLTFFTLSPIVP